MFLSYVCLRISFALKKQWNFNIFTSNVFAHAKSDISAVLKRKVHFSSALTGGATDLSVAHFGRTFLALRF